MVYNWLDRLFYKNICLTESAYWSDISIDGVALH